MKLANAASVDGIGVKEYLQILIQWKTVISNVSESLPGL